MRVLIAAAQFSSNISGLQRHALALPDCLLRQPDVTEIHFVLAPWQQHLVHHLAPSHLDRIVTHIAEMDRGLVSRNMWFYRELPRLVARVQPDIVHLSYPVPVDRASIKRPVVLTLHDLYPYDIPENFGFPKVWFNRAILRQCLHSVDATACVSDTTLSRLKRYVSRSTWSKALRIYNCVVPSQECAEDSPLPGWNGEPFFLTVSQHRKNKNIALLLHVFRDLLEYDRIQPSTKLVVVGIAGPETSRIHKLVSELRLHERVVFLEGLSDAALQWCYRHCELVAAPSEIEGFGLPVAEALLAGCRVVCSDIPAFREIDESHCHFAQLGTRFAENLCDAIVASLNQPRPSQVSLPQFLPEILGAQYVDLYRRLLPVTAEVEHPQPFAQVRISTANEGPLGRRTGDA